MLGNLEFINTSGLDFKDISTEIYRTYVFPDKSITIDAPLKLHVSKNGHRVFDKSGKSHYIPNKYIEIIWEVHEGKSNFSL